MVASGGRTSPATPEPRPLRRAKAAWRDRGKPERLVEIVRGVDALVIEATYLKEENEMAETFGHSTAERSARLAKEAGVGKLILSHLSRRYRDDQILEEARSVFPETYVARDFDSFQVKTGT